MFLERQPFVAGVFCCVFVASWCFTLRTCSGRFRAVITCCRNAIITLFAVLLSLSAWAGGSGLNVVVVVNQNSTNSVQLGNYYCEQRGVPPQNLLRINWAGDNIDWTRAELYNTLRAPLNAMLTSRGLSNQIDYVVLAMDIPYRVSETTGSPVTSGVNSTTAALFYGFKPDGCSSCARPSCNLAPGSANHYAESEGVYRQTTPISSASNSWQAMMLTANDLAQAKFFVDRAMASDYTFPTQKVYLAKGGDRFRNIRHYLFDDAIINARILGIADIVRTNIADPTGLGAIQGYQCGEQLFPLSATNFLSGALADDLTSFSGFILENSGHTDALDLLTAGAVASHGTVIEPCAYYQKFPLPQVFFYQSRGFNAAESYYLSLINPYQGLLVGEPLAAPYAQSLTGTWSSPLENATLNGMVNLGVNFQGGVHNTPIQQMDLFVDGVYAHTVTNFPPQQSSIVYVTVNGFQTNYAIPANATLQSVASNLTLRLNATAFTNATKVQAIAVGDRIELRSLDITRAGATTTLSGSNYVAPPTQLTTRINAARNVFLDHLALGLYSYAITNSLGSNVPVGSWLQAVAIKTNGAVVSIGVTNTSGGNTLRLFARELFDRINTNTSLATAEGVLVDNVNLHEDEPYAQYVYGYDDHSGSFDVYARSPGWPESQVRMRFMSSSGIMFTPGTTNRLDANFTDLQPRNHLYLTAGVTNLNLTFPFNTTTNSDGYHELTAVAYEGSHVRTQTRISRDVRIQNNNWAATLSCLVGDTNTALEATLQFAVSANTNNITKIELFSTGGSLGASNNVTNTTFSVAASYLDIGRHPFYAVVTRNDGKQYRTETLWLRIVGADWPFNVTALDATPTLTWPAAAGRSYSILSATNVADLYTLRDGVVPTNSLGVWSETNNSVGQRFYRVRTP
jgi:uncharacterized protein (TIGR03790 family)